MDPESQDETQLTADLADARRSLASLQARVRTAEDEVLRLRAKSQRDGRAVSELTRQKNSLSVRIRDKEDELVQKGEHLRRVQDDILSLEIETTQAQRQKEEYKKKAGELKRDNEDLVRRWMKRKEEEADSHNKMHDIPTRKRT